MSPLFNTPGDGPRPPTETDQADTGAGKDAEISLQLPVNPTGLVSASSETPAISDADYAEASAKLQQQERKRAVVDDWRAGPIKPERQLSAWEKAVVWLTRIAQIAALILAAISIFRQWQAAGLSLQDFWSMVSPIIVASWLFTL
jgi:hypothetical protein